ncbi:uncharacterized protein TNIN_71741 [Trichonephila inaurata madagascariensis]|uniref:Uncharacterized protein n=1 Tax=Trichonephila inaurata madagascariensis TaxID=2747483 RepID=A0A8X6X6J0_9ARAC|nr:uncharacterized protein TNIN_71741 [Trichonephila inaurata madagascariensis]
MAGHLLVELMGVLKDLSFILIMELFELFQIDFSHVFIITILLLTIFPVRSLALFCLTCLFPIFHPMCCRIFHTCCKANATCA